MGEIEDEGSEDYRVLEDKRTTHEGGGGGGGWGGRKACGVGSLKCICAPCAWLSLLAETQQPPRIWAHVRGSYMVSQDRRHLFVTPRREELIVSRNIYTISNKLQKREPSQEVKLYTPIYSSQLRVSYNKKQQAVLLLN